MTRKRSGIKRPNPDPIDGQKPSKKQKLDNEKKAPKIIRIHYGKPRIDPTRNNTTLQHYIDEFYRVDSRAFSNDGTIRSVYPDILTPHENGYKRMRSRLYRIEAKTMFNRHLRRQHDKPLPGASLNIVHKGKPRDSHIGIATSRELNSKGYCDVIGFAIWNMEDVEDSDDDPDIYEDGLYKYQNENKQGFNPEVSLQVTGNPRWFAKTVKAVGAKWCELERIATHPDWRGKRIGRNLLHFGIQEARARGKDAVYIEATKAAKGFYAKLGCQQLHEWTFDNPRGEGDGEKKGWGPKTVTITAFVYWLSSKKDELRRAIRKDPQVKLYRT